MRDWRVMPGKRYPERQNTRAAGYVASALQLHSSLSTTCFADPFTSPATATHSPTTANAPLGSASDQERKCKCGSGVAGDGPRLTGQKEVRVRCPSRALAALGGSSEGWSGSKLKNESSEQRAPLLIR